MALGGLGPLDPNALAATKLRPGGMTAQEVGYKRKAMEDAMGAQKLAADVKNKATDQKQREANMKAFPPITDTVALPYTQEWNKRMAGEQRQLANDLLLFKQGKGSDPNNPLSEAGMARLARNIGHKQYAANTNAYYKLTNDLLTDIDQHPGSYVDGAKEQVLAAQRDVKIAETGEYPDLAGRLFDLQKHVDTELGHLKASGSGQAITLPDGSIKTTSSEYILADDVKAGIKAALQRPEARAEARRWFANMPKDDQDAVMEFAKNNGMTPDEAMIYNVEMPVYSYTKYKESLQQPSEAGSGRQLEQEGMNWLAEWRKGVEEGKYEGAGSLDLFGISAIPKSQIPEAYRTLSGWVYDKYKNEEGKDRETRIREVSVARGKEKWTITLDNGETREIPFDKFESEVIPRLGALNADKLKGIATYIKAAKESGYFKDIKGTGTEEMVKTAPQKKTAYQTTQRKKSAY